MYIKNISAQNILIGGAVIGAGNTKALDDIGSREYIRAYSEQLLQHVTQGRAEIQYPDGSKEDRITAIHTLIMQGFIGVDINKVPKNFYFLKDSFRLKKDESAEKYFLGYCTGVWVTSTTSPVKVTVKTKQGLSLPADRIVKNQNLEFDWPEGMKDPEIEIEAEATTDVVIYVEGWNDATPTKNIQRFINTWGEDVTQWSTSKPVLGAHRFNPLAQQCPDLIEDDVNGHTLRIYDDRYPNGTGEYLIYEVKTGKEYAVELVENNLWSPYNINRYHLHVNNIKFIQFNDQTVDLTLVTLPPYSDHSLTKEQD